MDILKIAAVILVCVLLISSLPTFNKSISYMISLSCGVIVLLYIINISSDAILQIQDVITNSGISDFSIVFKAMGISLITQFVSDTATDSGNKSLANQMVFVGKVAIIVLALPVFTQILGLIGKFTG